MSTYFRPWASCHGHNIILCISEATPKSGASPKKKVKEAAVTPSRPISHPRFKPGGEQHNVRILEQPTSSMHLDLQKKEESKAASANSGMKCSLCDFTATRINVLIMHTKTHRYIFISDYLKKEHPKKEPICMLYLSKLEKRGPKEGSQREVGPKKGSADPYTQH